MTALTDAERANKAIERETNPTHAGVHACENFHLTDLGNAQRLVAMFGQDIHYCYKFSQWFVWTGSRWRADDSGAISRMAKKVIMAIYAEAANVEDKDRRTALIDHARRSESDNKLSAMINLARSEEGMSIAPEEFDSNLWLLNCLNGTINLKTGELLPHRREDLITKQIQIAYNPQAKLELWDSFLSEVTDGDRDYETFLQRATGYSLTGNIGEEKLYFIHGPTATGKSTFLEAIKSTLGEYAKTADFETFISNGDTRGPRPDIARLVGSRMVTSIEVSDGRKLAEGLVKLLTGGDTVTARFLYSCEFEFRPQFKLWLASNHAPKVSDDDDAIWRRILKLPFNHEIPPEKRDPIVKTTLRNPDIAGPAILAWAVKGCLDWQKQGLIVPQKVVEATEAYRNENDPLRDFFETTCKFDKEEWIANEDLRPAYEAWAKECGIKHPLGGKSWAARLKAKGCEQKTIDNKRGWQGIMLLTNKDRAPDMSETKLHKNTENTPLPESSSYEKNKYTLQEVRYKNTEYSAFLPQNSPSSPVAETPGGPENDGISWFLPDGRHVFREDLLAQWRSLGKAEIPCKDGHITDLSTYLRDDCYGPDLSELAEVVDWLETKR